MKENIEAVTGYKLTITEEINEGNAVCISLGNTELYQKSGIQNSSDLNEDGFYVRRIGKTVFINGETEYSLINGVNYFSEKYFGVKHLTIDYTRYGEEKTLCLADVENETVAPDFAQRDYFAYQTMRDSEYGARLGYESLHKQDSLYNGEGIICGSIHGLSKLLPYSKYPQFYGVSSDGSQNELDLTNGMTNSYTFDSSKSDSMIATLITLIKQSILADDTGKYVLLGLQDNDFIASGNDNYLVKWYLGGYAGLYIRFCNIVAEEVYAWMESEGIEREIRFIAVSYWKTWEYRECKITANEHVDIMLCDMFCQYHAITDSCNSVHKERFQGWKGKLSANSELWIYNYATNFTHSLLWFDNFKSLETNIRYYNAQGVNKVLYQAHPHAYNYYQGNLENYILSKLLWDSSLDIDDLVYAYNVDYYGDSASVVNRVYDNLRSIPSDDFYLGLYTNEVSVANAYPLAKLNENIHLLETEIARINTIDTLSETEKQARVLRILELEVQLRYMVLVNWEAYGVDGDKNAYACDLIYSFDLLGIKYVGEGQSVQTLKDEYCVDLSSYLTLTYDGVVYSAESPMKLTRDALFIDLTKLSLSCSLNGVQANYRWSLYHGSTCLMSTDDELSKAYFDTTDDHFYSAVNNYGGTYRIKVEVVSTQGYIGTVWLYYNTTII